MSWEDRIREAAYTPPSGERLTFNFVDLSSVVDKKTTAFDFPDASGSYVQDNGHTGRRYPIRVIFSGADCDLDADTFDAALLEKGQGTLEHPMYGRVDVVPFGTITRRDNLTTAANQATIDVVFWSTIGVVYPGGILDPLSAILDTVSGFNDFGALAFAARIVTDTATKLEDFKSKAVGLLDTAYAKLEPIAATTSTIKREIDNIKESVDLSIDILIEDPLTLASQVMQLVEAPARAGADIRARVETYANMALDIIGASRLSPSTELNTNTYSNDELHVTAAVASIALAAVADQQQYTTRSQAIEVAETLAETFEAVTVWRDDNNAEFNIIDTGEAYSKLQDIVAITTAYLVDISFTLRQERALTLNRERSIIELTAELYGAVDDELDALINTNNLTGTEILTLPAGRRIVYYV